MIEIMKNFVWIPSNGQESREFVAENCNKCLYNLAHYIQEDNFPYFCPILDNTIDDEPEKPNQWREKEGKSPYCTAFVPKT